jgi:hypothetical protein
MKHFTIQVGGKTYTGILTSKHEVEDMKSEWWQKSRTGQMFKNSASVEQGSKTFTRVRHALLVREFKENPHSREKK